MEKYTYLLVDFFCISIPFIFSFHPKLKFIKQWRHFVVPCLATASFFLIWDILFTCHGVWSFNSKKVIGIYFFNLPVEELLFFICIPYACLFTYHAISLFVKIKSYTKPTSIFSIFLILCLVLTAVLHIKQLYTSVTFFLLAIMFIFILFKKVNWLTHFYFSFLLILIPFFISNGVLTGSWIDAPVVIYNDRYNLGIRLLTIPLEDIFYGMLLFLMNVNGFEFSKRKFIS